jgi:hypothetical protein
VHHERVFLWAINRSARKKCKKKPPEGGEKTGNYINAMKRVHAARLRVARRVGYSIDTA